MHSGERVALMTDARAPGLSDPGYYLVRLCCAGGIAVEALPGPMTLVPALTASGPLCDRLVFEGFFPVCKGRSKRLAQRATEPCVPYEGPHRLARTLSDLAEMLEGAVGSCRSRTRQEI